MTNLNTNEVEAAFNDLIEELEKIKQLSDIAELHKENADILNQKIREYYEFAKTRDVALADNLNNYLSKMDNIQVATEKQFNLSKDKIDELITYIQYNISASTQANSTITELSKTQAQEFNQLKKRNTAILVINAIILIATIAILCLKII